MFKLIPIILLLLLALIIAAVRYLPWWGILLLVVGVYLFFKFAFGRLLLRIFLVPFKMKGAVLRGARAEVHSVELAPPPPPRSTIERPIAALEHDGNGLGNGKAEEENEALDEDDDEDTDDEDLDDADFETESIPREYYQVDVTITPGSHSGAFQHWEPSELLVVPYDAKISRNFRDLDVTSMDLHDLEIFRDGAFMPDEEGKYFGPLRLRMVMGLPLDTPRRLKFRYYLEAFGELILPPSLGSSARMSS
ncbi:MAG TPA: hypothetical protein VGY53_07440 [Isosphaeraceae bacterium]|nr:hypothetical protein [Isosphaeraceae bacterium]